jgi:hypothetical protein
LNLNEELFMSEFNCLPPRFRYRERRRHQHLTLLRFVFFALLGLPTLNSQAGTPPGFLWARSAGGISNEVALALAADPAGNVLVAGYFNGSLTIGASNLVSSGLEDIFLAKYDPAGNPLWVRKAGGIGYDEARGIATDPAGNIYLTGHFQNTANFGASTVTSSGYSDIFVAKYDPIGTLLWVRSAGGNDYDEAHAIAVDPAGNAYITGFIDANATFGSFSLVNRSASDDVFVAKCSSAGTFLWAVRAGGDLDDLGNGIALDGAANVYVTGYFDGSATFGSSNLTSAGTNNLHDVFLVKYDSAGNALWARQAGGAGDDAGNAVVASFAGNVSLTGSFVGPAAFGSTNLTSSGTDIFVARYDSSGNCLWVRRAGGNNSIYGDSGLGLAADDSGNVFAAGYFSGTSNFGPTNVLTAGFDDIFCTKYDAGGNVLWVRTVGGLNLDLSYAVAADPFGNVFIAGSFASSAIVFDGLTLTDAGGRDIFVAKLGFASVPSLSITFSNGQYILSWPATATGITLESTPWLSAPSWLPSADQGSIIGTNRVVFFSPSEPQRFYRLHRL